jgi:predicted RecB family nuclease
MRFRDDRLLLSPSDLNAFLACEHRTALDLRRARGELTPENPIRPDAELVAERGREHERDYLEHLERTVGEVVRIQDGLSTAEAAALTVEAMRAGANVVHQAALMGDGWSGYADFLQRVDEPSELGSWSYEAYDAKLAQHPKPYFILQLLFYSEQVARIQGREPPRMHLVLGSGEIRSFEPVDFAAYARRVKERLLHTLERYGHGVEPPYPYPVEHCAWCDWWLRCQRRRRDDDHLSLVAFLTRAQAIRLEDKGVPTVASLGALDASVQVPGVAAQTLAGLRQQARLQVESRDSAEPVRELLTPEAGRGLARLPAPSRGDVFFDIEGDPYWGDDGLEYLFGSVTVEGHDPAFTALWAHDKAQEHAMFEQWLDWVTARLHDHPDLHVYHYNHYEPTAIKKLAARYGMREHEVDELLRRHVFVDLYTVVRQSMRVGEESYSLKRLERFHDFDRDAEVTEAGGSLLAYQEYLDSQEPSKLEAIADYNRDDCLSTLSLRDWLLDQKSEAEEQFGLEIDALAAVEAEQSEQRRAREAELAQLQERLTLGLATDEAEWTEEDRARVLVADLLEYHRREAKPQWWAFFERLGKTPGELCNEDAEAIGNLALAEDLPVEDEKQSWIFPLRFPPQQHKIGPGRAIDPEREQQLTVWSVDEAAGIVRLKRGKQSHGKPLPRSIAPSAPIEQRSQQGVLRELAERVIEHGLEPTGLLDAACDMLLRRPPRLAGHPPGAPLHRVGVDLDVLSEQVAALDGSTLFVQGPPGAGKTYTGARVAVSLLRDSDLRIGVAATSHKAIHKLLQEIEEAAAETDLSFRGLKKASNDNPESAFESAHIESSTDNDDFPPSAAIRLLAGTPWLFSRESMRAAVDVLFVDEAGQVALADALAVSAAARSVVLLGDPQQLAHVSQGTHPRGSGVSVLQHLLGEAPTVSPDRGVFLDRTWRMHPDVCGFVSDAMYDSRLLPVDGLDRQTIESSGLSGAGVRMLHVEHIGSTQRAEEEAELLSQEVDVLLRDGRFTDFDGVERALTLDDILVVAPYNAQVRCLRAKLPDGARVGTVDKFQGQQAPVVFFSMTSSSGEDVPRGMDFLFSRSRLNVAVSRAQALSVVVCSRQLLWARCNSVDQMRLVNALCRFAEEAERQSSPVVR